MHGRQMPSHFLQVNERIRSYVPGRGRGRGPGGPPIGPPGAPVAPFRGGPQPGRGPPGRGPTAGPYIAPRGPQGQYSFRGRDAAPSFDSQSERPPRQNSFVSRDAREQPQAPVRDRPRLSSAISQDFQRPLPAAETPVLESKAAEVRLIWILGLCFLVFVICITSCTLLLHAAFRVKKTPFICGGGRWASAATTPAGKPCS